MGRPEAVRPILLVARLGAKCGDVTDRDGQILGIGGDRQQPAAGQPAVTRVVTPCAGLSVRTRAWPVDPFWAAGARGSDETPNLF